jgi:DNA invertase Pin-like site-specific DNA recombinase
VPVEKVRTMHSDGVGPSAIAKALGISRMSVHRVLKDQPERPHTSHGRVSVWN